MATKRSSLGAALPVITSISSGISPTTPHPAQCPDTAAGSGQRPSTADRRATANGLACGAAGLRRLRHAHVVDPRGPRALVQIVDVLGNDGRAARRARPARLRAARRKMRALGCREQVPTSRIVERQRPLRDPRAKARRWRASSDRTSPKSPSPCLSRKVPSPLSAEIQLAGEAERTVRHAADSPAGSPARASGRGYLILAPTPARTLGSARALRTAQRARGRGS